ncbi:hypothetical protein ACQU0X_27930 [Pseudovibrio ascidiaceicola]|uniref:hypothetical protein n=1 Tax=Pseudovibrio ascidiaceicola TaxID=285279 RepID=UPI003D35CE7F
MKARRLPNSIAPSWGYFCRTDNEDNYVLGSSPMAKDVFKAWVQCAAALYPLKDVEYFIAPSLYELEFSLFREAQPFCKIECCFHNPNLADLLAALLFVKGAPFLMRVRWNGAIERETVVNGRSAFAWPASVFGHLCSQGRSELLQVYENSVLRAA